MNDTIYLGDARDWLRAMAAAGVRARTCVTSPPYFQLRDYQVEGQIGLEGTINEYIATMVAVFGLVRDVLTDDGTVFLNMGDSYNSRSTNGGIGANSAINGNGSHDAFRSAQEARRRISKAPKTDANVGGGTDVEIDGGARIVASGLKPKDMIGMPWRLAFALQEDGWYLRQDIILHKPNPMPESVKDRCTKAHEYLFLLAKSERYYFNSAAIREPIAEDTEARYERGRSNDHKWADGGPGNQSIAKSFDHMKKPVAGNVPWEGSTRNKRSVWTIPTAAYAEAHFATYPRALVRPCVLAGSEPGDLVLDPFGGSGTTVEVALSLGRRGVMIELNPKYVELARRRLSSVTYGLPLTTDAS